MTKVINVFKFFNEGISASLGCTEPSAIGLAVAIAFNALKGRLPADYSRNKISLSPTEIEREIKQIVVEIDRDIFKNTLQVGIPYKCQLRGVDNAAALGLFCDPNKSLELFRDLNHEKVLAAANLLKAKKVEVIPNYKWDELRIEAEVTTRENTATAHIVREHSNVTYIGVDGQPKFVKPRTSNEADKLRRLRQLSDFITIAEKDLYHQPDSQKARKRIEDAIVTNHKASLIAERQLAKLSPKSTDSPSRNLVGNSGTYSDDINLAKEKVSLAVWSRMNGFDLKVKTCAGSGNLGLMSTLPLIAVACLEFRKNYRKDDINWNSATKVIREKAPEDWEKLVRAVAIVHLIANYVSLYSGKLSASCGCATKVGVGVAAAIAYYLTQVEDKDRMGAIGQAINNMGRSIVGMICDGGKVGCALKAAAATESAMESAFLACRSSGSAHSDGITDENALITLQHVGKIAKAMKATDKKIIEFLQDKIPQK